MKKETKILRKYIKEILRRNRLRVQHFPNRLKKCLIWANSSDFSY